MASQSDPPVSDASRKRTSPERFREASLNRARVRLLILVVILTATLGYLTINRSVGPVSDEKVYLDQIGRFIHGDYSVSPELAVPPTYHRLLAMLGRLTGLETLAGLRLLTLLLSLLCVPCFLAAARAVDPGNAIHKAYLFFFLPILLPFYFLLYTDVLALTLFLLAVWLGLRDRPYLAGFAALDSVLVRQNMVVWLCFLLVLLWGQETGWRFRLPLLGRQLRRYAVFLLALAGFAFFVLYNRSLVLGATSQYHPPGIVHLSNVFFSLFVCTVLFLPLFAAQTPQVLALVRQRPWLLAALAGLLGLYLLTFRGDHPMNQLPGYLRNERLQFALHNIWTRLLFFLPIAWAVLGLLVTPLRRPVDYWLYPFWVLVLLPVWLVEQRYYLPGFALLLLFRVPASPGIERGLLAWQVLLSGLFLWLLCWRGLFL